MRAKSLAMLPQSGCQTSSSPSRLAQFLWCGLHRKNTIKLSSHQTVLCLLILGLILFFGNRSKCFNTSPDRFGGLEQIGD
jgi:hypothetical protein